MNGMKVLVFTSTPPTGSVSSFFFAGRDGDKCEVLLPPVFLSFLSLSEGARLCSERQLSSSQSSTITSGFEGGGTGEAGLGDCGWSSVCLKMISYRLRKSGINILKFFKN